MNQKAKLLARALATPAALMYEEFLTLLRQNGFELRNQSGSHKQWLSSKNEPLTTQPRKDGKAHKYQVLQALSMMGVSK
jgi:predicted RNA binding protein YcfA (HicA-like mRNA interferase family)